MTNQLTMFNATAVSISVIVNNGDAFKIAGTSPSLQLPWFPMPATPPAPYNLGPKAQGVFGVGDNQCCITPDPSPGLNNVVITIPATVMPTDALQLYIFYENTEHVSWMLLKNGHPIEHKAAFKETRAEP